MNITNNPVYQWGKNFINKINLESSKSILDIGCRQGSLSAHLANIYPHQHITAIDIMDTELEKANHHQHLSNLTFEKADALYLGCTDSFDAIVSFSCLHWIHNKIQVLQNIYQALKPGGKAYLQFFALHGRLKNDRFLYQTAKNQKWKSYFQSFTPQYHEINLSECCTLLQHIGFVIHRCEFAYYQTNFEHSDKLREWYTTWAYPKNYIPQAKQDHFIADAVHSYLTAHGYGREQAFPYPEYILEVICEKPIEPSQASNKIPNSYGGISFTKQELLILRYFLQGKSAKESSLLLPISSKTVEFHLANIKKKLKCYRRSDIYEAAINLGFINLIFNTQ